MLIKICGLQRVEDVRTAAALAADFIGFVFAPSRRQVTARQAAVMTQGLSGVQRVGVFVDHPLPELLEIVEIAKLDIVQLHGEETADYRRQIPRPVIKAIRVGDPAMPEDIIDYPAEYFLLDTYAGAQRGGSGKTFDWAAALELRQQIRQPVFAAGGLTPENVEQCITILQPQGVDVSGGVETAGVKDAAKIRRFIENARQRER